MTNLSFADRKYRRSSKTPLLLPQKHEPAEAGVDGASFSGAVFNLSTTIVGAGIMALPATLKQCGMIPGLIVIILAAMVTESSIDMMVRFSRATKHATYSGVVGDAFGGFGRTLLQACVVVNNMGMLIVYMIIIGDVLSGTGSPGVHHYGVIEEWFGQHWWTKRSFSLLLTTIFVFGPLIIFKRVDSLRYTSALSVALAVVFVVITAGIVIVKLMNGSIGMPRLLPEFVDQASFWKLFTIVPVLVTAYICHHNVHPIENELSDPTQMKSIVRTSLTLCSSVYVATSFFGFLLFGDQTMDDILANFDGNLGIPYSSAPPSPAHLLFLPFLLMEDLQGESFKHKKKSSLCISCCFRKRETLNPNEHTPRLVRASSVWLKSRAHELPEIKDKCRNLISKMGRRRRHSADFRYDAMSYALNFDEGYDDSHEADECPLRNFSSRLPPSPLPSPSRVRVGNPSGKMAAVQEVVVTPREIHCM